MYKILIALFILLMSPNAFAEGVVQNETDESLYYLRIIFGDAVAFLTGHDIPNAREHDSIIGAMAEVFNTQMQVLSLILVMWNAIIWYTDTAQRGKVDEQRFDTVWLPTRMLISILVVTPISGGYNTLQMGVFYVAGAGINTGNAVAVAAQEYMRKNGSVISLKHRTKVKKLAISVLESYVCMISYNQIKANNGEAHIAIKKAETNTRNRSGISDAHTSIANNQLPIVSPTTLEFQWTDEADTGWFEWSKEGDNACGVYEIDRQYNPADIVEDSQAYMAYKAEHLSVLRHTFTELEALAHSIVHSTDMGNNEVTTSPVPTKLYEIVRDADRQLQEAVSAFQADTVNDPENSSVDIRQTGWIRLGGLFWEWTLRTRERLEMVNSVYVARTEKITSDIATSDEPAMKKAFEALEKYILHDAYADIDGQQKKLSELKYSYVSPMMSAEDFEKNIEQQEAEALEYFDGVMTPYGDAIGLIGTYTSDPVTTLAEIGERLLVTIDTAYLASLELKIMENAANNSLNSLGGKFLGSVGLGVIVGAFTAVTSSIISALFLLIMALAPLAFLMVFYIPSIPLIQWVVSIVSYYAYVLEVVIISSVHALAHGLPEGKGPAGQHAKQGYMMILGVFLSPTLMVFGFVAAIVLTFVGGFITVSMFNEFWDLSRKSFDNHWQLTEIIFEPFMQLMIFCLIMIAISTRAFQLISELRDRALKMVGGGQENLGDSSSMGQASSQFAMMGGIGGAAFSGAQHGAKMDQAKKDPNGGGGPNKTGSGGQPTGGNPNDPHQPKQ